MSDLLAEERPAHGRWVNTVAGLLLPGSAQFLSGRRAAGLGWLLANIGFRLAFIFFYSSPFVKSAAPAEIARFLALGLWLATILDGGRKPIPRLRFGAWSALVLLAIAIPVLPFLAVRQFLLQPFSIPTESMLPTLRADGKGLDGRATGGDRFFVNKWRYRFREPERGDLIAFKAEGIEIRQSLHFRISDNQIFLKRLVGLPGEKVSIRPPYVYINGKKLVEPKIFETIAEGLDGYGGFRLAGTDQEIELGRDEFYVLGDNTASSLDSRFFGRVKRASIVGKVAWIYWPPERRGIPQ